MVLNNFLMSCHDSEYTKAFYYYFIVAAEDGWSDVISMGLKYSLTKIRVFGRKYNVKCPAPREIEKDSKNQKGYLFILFILFYLFVFPGLVTLSILHTEKLHCCRNITSWYNINIWVLSWNNIEWNWKKEKKRFQINLN